MAAVIQSRPLNVKEASYLHVQYTNTIVVCGLVRMPQRPANALLAAIRSATARLALERPVLASHVVMHDRAHGPEYALELRSEPRVMPVVVTAAPAEGIDSLEFRERLYMTEAALNTAEAPRVHVAIDAAALDAPDEPRVTKALLMVAVPHCISDGRATTDLFCRLLQLVFLVPPPAAPAQTLADSAVAFVPPAARTPAAVLGMCWAVLSFFSWLLVVGKVAYLEPLAEISDGRLVPATPRAAESKTTPASQPQPHAPLPLDKLPKLGSRVKIIALSQDETARVLAAAKRHGCTVTAAVALAAAKSVAPMLALTKETYIMGCFPIDNRALTPVGPHVDGCFITGALLPHRMHDADHDTLAEISAMLKKQTRISNRYLGAHFLPKKTTPPVAKLKRGAADLWMSYGVSSLGKYPALDLGPGVAVEDLLFGSSAIMGNGPILDVTAITFGGQMTLVAVAPTELVTKSFFDATAGSLRTHLLNIQ
ncbi:hypothetical protein HK105_205936 [Polyrhizophydium stewartii]|uniref:Alcohol acetyltransferase n=1 Tax=Polyrhizophydium stewartii TaxID=2732419 RepID=A0ABR4N546_9FUNG|nr:hypothetical protein HK105_001603 [Polyrhizophydium stewartii]